MAVLDIECCSNIKLLHPQLTTLQTSRRWDSTKSSSNSIIAKQYSNRICPQMGVNPAPKCVPTRATRQGRPVSQLTFQAATMHHQLCTTGPPLEGCAHSDPYCGSEILRRGSSRSALLAGMGSKSKGDAGPPRLEYPCPKNGLFNLCRP